MDKKVPFFKKTFTKVVAWASSVLLAFSAGGATAKNQTDVNQTAAAATVPQTAIVEQVPTSFYTSSPVITVNGVEYVADLSTPQLAPDQAFQLRQTQDSPSITFDFTDNFKPKTFEPMASSVFLAAHPDKNSWEEFTNLDEIINEVYGVKEEDTEVRFLIAQAILKENPDLAKKVTKGTVDYYQGDVSNIPPELILSTDYSSDLKQPLRIFLPTVNVVAERRNDTDSKLTISTEFIAENANENNVATVTISKKDFARANSPDAKNEVIDRILAEAYDIPTMQSYAGDAIWHGVALWEENKEAFAGASEEDTRRILLEYIADNGSVTLELPRIAVTVIEEESTLEQYGSVQEMLMQEKDRDVTIAYLTPDRPVYDLTELGTTKFRPIDILDTVHFMDGTSLKEALEANQDKYEGFVLAGFRQLIDNNNSLLGMFEADNIQIVDLYTEIDLSTISTDEAKINLQPIAYAYPECDFVCDEKPVQQTPPKETTPPEETTPPPTETTPPPTETTPPPTETTPPPTETTPPQTETTPPPTETTPPPTECPDMPDVEQGEDEDPEDIPVFPDNPDEDVTLPPCPSEPNQPGSGEEDKDPSDGGFDLGGDGDDDVPPSDDNDDYCPPSGEQPGSGEIANGPSDGGFDLGNDEEEGDEGVNDNPPPSDDNNDGDDDSSSENAGDNNPPSSDNVVNDNVDNNPPANSGDSDNNPPSSGQQDSSEIDNGPSDTGFDISSDNDSDYTPSEPAHVESSAPAQVESSAPAQVESSAPASQEVEHAPADTGFSLDEEIAMMDDVFNVSRYV